MKTVDIKLLVEKRDNSYRVYRDCENKLETLLRPFIKAYWIAQFGQWDWDHVYMNSVGISGISFYDDDKKEDRFFVQFEGFREGRLTDEAETLTIPIKFVRWNSPSKFIASLRKSGTIKDD
jgi:hypothetical protein